MPKRRAIEATNGVNLMEAIRDNGFDDLQALCGGCASCATCHVLIEPEWMSKLPDRDQAELMLLQYAEHYDPDRSRLSCQLELGPEIDGMPLTIAPEE